MKTVLQYDEDDEPVVLAKFEIRDGKVVATYQDMDFQDAIQEQGIFKSGVGTLFPVDGQAFYDALGTAFANSSRMWVETEASA